MKTKNILSLLTLTSLSLTVANGATIIQSVGNTDWNSAIWGDPAAEPTSLNDYVTATGVASDNFRIGASGTDSTFLGGNIEAISGTTALVKTLNGNTATMNGTFTLTGGSLFFAPNSASTATFATGGFIVTGTGSTYNAGNAGANLTITGGLSGSGDFDIFQSGSTNLSKIISFDTASAYTGAMSVVGVNSLRTVTLDFNSDFTFGGLLELGSNSLLNVDQDITFNSGDLTIGGSAIADGTYSGAALDGLGANFTNNGGTLIVGVIPEPSSTALLGLGGLLLILRRRK